MNKTDISNEFNRQLQNLINKGYHKASKLTEENFRSKITLLESKLYDIHLTDIDLERGKLPFVIVIKNSLVPSERMMTLVEKDDRNGVTILRPHLPQDFKELEGLTISDSEVYLILDIDRGKESINIPPNEAIRLIKNADRSPLTIDEGIAIVTHFPEFLIKNNCFSLLGSRTGTDQRVPAIWINSKKEPNLGWCWDGNPHTWLGSASCRERIV